MVEDIADNSLNAKYELPTLSPSYVAVIIVGCICGVGAFVALMYALGKIAPYVYKTVKAYIKNVMGKGIKTAETLTKNTQDNALKFFTTTNGTVVIIVFILLVFVGVPVGVWLFTNQPKASVTLSASSSDSSCLSSDGSADPSKMVLTSGGCASAGDATLANGEPVKSWSSYGGNLPQRNWGLLFQAASVQCSKGTDETIASIAASSGLSVQPDLLKFVNQDGTTVTMSPLDVCNMAVDQADGSSDGSSDGSDTCTTLAVCKQYEGMTAPTDNDGTDDAADDDTTD